MKPLPILLAAAGIAAAAGGYVWMTSSPALTGSSVDREQRPLDTAAVSAPAASGQETGSEVAAGPSTPQASRIGRSFRASDDDEKTPDDGTPATAPATASVTVNGSGISTENLRTARRRSSSVGPVSTRAELAGYLTERERTGTESPSMAAANIGFGALATTNNTPGAGASQESSSGILSHPGLVAPAAPRVAGVPVEQLAADDAAAAVPSINSPQVPREKGKRPPWPTGPFTPEQELYRAQIGSENFNHWLNEEALKQRSGM